MSKGGMQTSAVHHRYCPICNKIVSVQIGNIYKHITQKGTSLYCFETQKRVRLKQLIITNELRKFLEGN